MTDEEIADEYAHNNIHYEVAKREDGTAYAKEVSDVTIKQAFLAGIKTGRPKWNNLIKEPEKLPEYEKVVEIWIKGMDFPNSACRESLGGGEWRWWVYWGSGYEIGNKSAVIAWREIEKPQF